MIFHLHKCTCILMCILCRIHVPREAFVCCYCPKEGGQASSIADEVCSAHGNIGRITTCCYPYWIPPSLLHPSWCCFTDSCQAGAYVSALRSKTWVEAKWIHSSSKASFSTNATSSGESNPILNGYLRNSNVLILFLLMFYLLLIFGGALLFIVFTASQCSKAT